MFHKMLHMILLRTSGDFNNLLGKFTTVVKVKCYSTVISLYKYYYIYPTLFGWRYRSVNDLLLKTFMHVQAHVIVLVSLFVWSLWLLDFIVLNYLLNCNYWKFKTDQDQERKRHEYRPSLLKILGSHVSLCALMTWNFSFFNFFFFFLQ